MTKLILAFGLMFATVLQAHAACPPQGSISEWSGYSNGIEPGFSGVFKPGPCFAILHIDSVDIALNGNSQNQFGFGEVAVFEFVATYADGSRATSGETGFFPRPQLFDILPHAYWLPQMSSSTGQVSLPNGKRMTSLSYSFFTVNAPPVDPATAIIQATGFEIAR
jgi:hypothetical protein